MSEKSFEEIKPNGTSGLKIALGLVLLLIIASFLFRWLAAFIVPILLIANRDLVFYLVGKIVGLYQQDMLKGIGATVLAFILFTPFTVFLFFRTIFYMVTGNTIATTETMESIENKGKTIIDLMPDITGKDDYKKEKKPKKKEQPKEEINDDEDRMMTLEEIRRKLEEDDDF